MKKKDYKIKFSDFYERAKHLYQGHGGIGFPDEIKAYYLLAANSDGTYVTDYYNRRNIWNDSLTDDQLSQIESNYNHLSREEYLDLFIAIGEEDLGRWSLKSAAQPIKRGEKVAIIVQAENHFALLNLFQKYSKILGHIKQPDVNKYYSGSFIVTSSRLVDVDTGLLQVFATRANPEELHEFASSFPMLIMEKIAQRTDQFKIMGEKSNTFEYDFDGESFRITKIGLIVNSLDYYIEDIEKSHGGDPNFVPLLQALKRSYDKTFREEISESVIDASGKFIQKRKDRITNHIVSGFERQGGQEQFVNDKINEIIENVNSNFSKFQAKLALPTLLKDVNNDLFSIFSIVSLYDKQDPVDQEIARFVKNNQAKFENALVNLKNEIAVLEEEADSLDWPAPWRRYTQWPHFKQNTIHFENNINEILKDM